MISFPGPTALAGAFLSLLISGAALSDDHSVDGDTKLNDWLDQQYQYELSQHPEQLSLLAMPGADGRMDDQSEEGVRCYIDWLSNSARQLQVEFDYDQLSGDDQDSYDFWMRRARMARQGLPFLRHDYVFDQNMARYAHYPDFLINYHPVATEQDYLDYISRIGASADALGQLLERARLAAKDGIRPPRFAYEAVVQESAKIISGRPFDASAGADSAIWADANQKLDALLAASVIDSNRAAMLRGRTEAQLIARWLPAYQAIIDWMQADRVNSYAEAMGVSALPEGDAYYRYLLAYYTDGDLGADEIHALGLAEVSRIRAQMDAIRERVGFEGDLGQFLDYVRVDSQFYFPNTDAGRQAYLDQVEGFLSGIQAQLPQYFAALPSQPLEVRRVEPFQEQAGGAAYYQEGTPDGSRPGIYYVHLADMSALNTLDLQSVAYHEGYPGHHLQGSVAAARDKLPLFRSVDYSMAYVEGWALYAEQLAAEMGLFSNPYYELGRLSSEMWRALRLVVDTGLHAHQWSEQKAVDYILAHVPSTEREVRSEVRRYIVWPGQAVAYKIGMLKILELRERAKEQLGSQFDIREFHEQILGGGGVPLDVLERRVDRWLAGKAAP